MRPLVLQSEVDCGGPLKIGRRPYYILRGPPVYKGQDEPIMRTPFYIWNHKQAGRVSEDTPLV